MLGTSLIGRLSDKVEPKLRAFEVFLSKENQPYLQKGG